MTFDLYSVGDSAFLAQILNAVAALSGTGDMKMAAMIGMVFGVLVVAIESAWNAGQNINWMKAIMGWVAYLVMFGTTATVNIIDVYTGGVRPVANVPFGVAATGSWISAIGKVLTEKFEQAFSLPTMTADGFASSVKHLLAVRDLELYGQANHAGGVGVDYQKTLYNYLKSCTLVGIDMGLIDKDAFLSSSNALRDMKFDNNIYATRTFLPGDGPFGKIQGCADAHAAIMRTMGRAGSAFDIAMGKLLASRMGMPPSGTRPPSVAYSILQGDLNALAGIGNDARDYMRNALVKNLIARAEAGKAIEDHDIASALLITQATEQLRVQNAAEGTLFMRIVHPLMTFIEGFFYAISPIMMVLIAMGNFGFRLAGKYFMFILWVQLWMPVMAIVNLYLNMTLQGKMASLSTDVGLSPISLLGQVQAHAQMADWLSVAGMLAAATPAFAMMLMYGSAVAATHLAGRLSATDTIDEKQASPDYMKNHELLNMQAKYTYNDATGTVQTGATDVTGSLDMRSVMAQGVSSTRQELSSATHQLQNVAGQQSAHVTSSGEKWSVGDSVAHALQSTNASSFQFARQEALKAMQQTGWSDSLKQQIATEVGLKMPTTGGFAKAMGAVISSHFNTAHDETAKNVLDQARSLDESERVSAEFADKLSHDLREGKVREAADGVSDQQYNQFAESASKVATASKAYQETAQLQSMIGERGAFNYANLGAHLTEDKASLINQMVAHHHLRRQADEYARRLTKVFGGGKTGKRRAQAVGGLMALLSGAAGAHGGEQVEMYRDVQTALDYLGVNSTTTGMQLRDQSATDNQGVGAGAADPVKQNNIGAPDMSPKEQVEGTLKQGDHLVRQHHAQAERKVRDKAAAQVAQEKGRHLREKVERTLANDKKPGVTRIAGQTALTTLNGLKEGLRTASIGLHGIVKGIEGFGAAIHDAWDAVQRGESISIHDVVQDGFDRFLQAGGRDIEGAEELVHQTFFQYAKAQGLTDAQARLYADQSMEPMFSGMQDRLKQFGLDGSKLGGRYSQRIDKDRQAVADELLPQYKDKDGHWYGPDADKNFGDAVEMIEGRIQLAAATGDVSNLGMVGSYNATAKFGNLAPLDEGGGGARGGEGRPAGASGTGGEDRDAGRRPPEVTGGGAGAALGEGSGGRGGSEQRGGREDDYRPGAGMARGGTAHGQGDEAAPGGRSSEPAGGPAMVARGGEGRPAGASGTGGEDRDAGRRPPRKT